MWVRMGLHLLLLIPIVGVTYEFNRYVGGHDNRVTPVSYTHLDVYKRQTLLSCPPT